MKDYSKEFKETVVARSYQDRALKISPTIIKFNGFVYKTYKGKAVWRTPGFAKAALRYDVGDWLLAAFRRGEITLEEREKITNEIIKEAEFISLDISKEIAEHLAY